MIECRTCEGTGHEQWHMGHGDSQPPDCNDCQGIGYDCKTSSNPALDTSEIESHDILMTSYTQPRMPNVGTKTTK